MMILMKMIPTAKSLKILTCQKSLMTLTVKIRILMWIKSLKKTMKIRNPRMVVVAFLIHLTRLMMSRSLSLTAISVLASRN